MSSECIDSWDEMFGQKRVKYIHHTFYLSVLWLCLGEIRVIKLQKSKGATLCKPHIYRECTSNRHHPTPSSTATSTHKPRTNTQHELVFTSNRHHREDRRFQTSTSSRLDRTDGTHRKTSNPIVSLPCDRI